MEKLKKSGKIKSDNIAAIYAASADKQIKLPLYQTKISAGFP